MKLILKQIVPETEQKILALSIQIDLENQDYIYIYNFLDEDGNVIRTESVRKHLSALAKTTQTKLETVISEIINENNNLAEIVTYKIDKTEN